MLGDAKYPPPEDLSWEKSPRARRVRFEADMFVVELKDGRSLAIPLDWYPKIRDAPREVRESWQLVHDGLFLAWESLGYLFFVTFLLKCTYPMSEEDPFDSLLSSKW
jgi:hypothetical protein